MTEKEISEKTEFIRIKCSITSENLDRIVEREKLSLSQKKELTMLASWMLQHGELHLYYRLLLTPVKHFLVAMTLGKEIDDWISNYLNSGKLSVAYLADRLCGVALMNAYDDFRKMVGQKDDCRLGGFHFIGDRKDDPNLSEVLPFLKQDEITVNVGQNMIPSKTVLFEVEYQKNPKEDEKHICSQCQNKNCIFSMKTET